MSFHLEDSTGYPERNGHGCVAWLTVGSACRVCLQGALQLVPSLHRLGLLPLSPENSSALQTISFSPQMSVLEVSQAWVGTFMVYSDPLSPGELGKVPLWGAVVVCGSDGWVRQTVMPLLPDKPWAACFPE